MRKVLWLGVVVALLVAACGGDDDDDGAGAPVSGSTSLVANDFSFAPETLRAAPGDELTVAISNEGAVAHTFTIDDADVDVEIAPGESAEASVTVPDSGTTTFYCRFHRAQGMDGELVAE